MNWSPNQTSFFNADTCMLIINNRTRAVVAPVIHPVEEKWRFKILNGWQDRATATWHGSFDTKELAQEAAEDFLARYLGHLAQKALRELRDFLKAAAPEADAETLAAHEAFYLTAPHTPEATMSIAEAFPSDVPS